MKGSFLDSIMGKLHRTPYRCRGCQRRFYVYIRPDDKAEIAEVDTPDDGSAPDHDVAKPAEP
jgi:hypothetical protein